VSANSRDKKSPPPATTQGASGLTREDPTTSVRASGRSDGDVAIVCGVSDDGQGVDIIRKRGERIEAGTVRRLEQGKPIHGEVVRLRPREHFPMVCDVEVEVPAQRSSEPFAVSSGPAQVATETYRKNWDAIYGRSKKQGSMLN
jgi:hypothetical protein